MPPREAAAAPLGAPGAPAGGRGFALLSAGTVAVLALSWGYLLYMDWGMRHMDRGADMLLMPRMIGWRAVDLFLVFVMWALMMAAMMLPSALPAIALYGRARGEAAGFSAGYLFVWFGFSALATLLQWRLLEATLLTPMMKSASVPVCSSSPRSRTPASPAAALRWRPCSRGAPDDRARSAQGCGMVSTVWGAASRSCASFLPSA
jgi:predicted metal-binding membrane protein